MNKADYQLRHVSYITNFTHYKVFPEGWHYQMNILAIETSCDETAAAVLNDDIVLSNIISSQMLHSEFGGVVPELASREHLLKITTLTDEALMRADRSISEIDMIAATSEPGLIGALLVGLNFAKSLAMTLNKPFVPVNHIQAHIYSNFLQDKKPEFPFLSLIVSGGHTLLVLVKDYFDHKILGKTVDDAAGEAYDKVAKLLGLEYPGGPAIDKRAVQGNENFHKFPLANVKNSPYDFSFSGIKTSVLYFLSEINFHQKKNKKLIDDICASFQHAVTESLFQKTILAAERNNVTDIAISGGVSANSGLNKKFLSLIENGYRIFIPEHEFTTDNAAMIGITAYLKYKRSSDRDSFMLNSLKKNAKARLDYENF